ncbi:MAG: hypothetical protein CMJ78_27095 [Planctomycetaceae bacterium]|nr:hypothetical protein [Planctomycetaceae bacterium]
MSESTREFCQTMKGVALRGWIIGFLVQFMWMVAVLLFGDLIYRLHGDLFGLTTETLKIIHYSGMGIWKLSVLIFFFIPWLSLKLMLRDK